MKSVAQMMQEVGAGQNDRRPLTYDGIVDVFTRFAELVRAEQAAMLAKQAAQPVEPVGAVVLFGGDADLKEVSWNKGKMPPVGAVLYTTPPDTAAEIERLRDAVRVGLELSEALREWVKAIPQDTTLPAMPGIDGDWADDAIAKMKGVLG